MVAGISFLAYFMPILNVNIWGGGGGGGGVPLADS